MKQEAKKSKKQRHPAGAKAKFACGTLSYLAECRGTTQKPAASHRESPPEIVDRNIRKYPAAP